MSDFTFDLFSKYNEQRCAIWHPGFPADDNWSLADWSNAMVGEAGEAANKIKKIRRIQTGMARADADMNMTNLYMDAAFECADTITYADLLLTKMGFRTAQVLVNKFNLVSDREHIDLVIPSHLLYPFVQDRS